MDAKTVDGFGDEWTSYDQTVLSDKELNETFSLYFNIFPMEVLSNGVGADIGCGSGRWAKIIAPKVKKLYCIDASKQALEVSKKNLNSQNNVEFIESSVDHIPLEDESLDFAYSLGVLHHIPDTAEGIVACVKKLKRGAPLLIYLYYAFDNKPRWFYHIWKLSDYIRRIISKCPFKIKIGVTSVIAAVVYFPLARFSLFSEKLKFNVNNIPLSAYRNSSFYTMRTDALDRFGTRLEHRFTKDEIISMLKNGGLSNIRINNAVPYWTAIGFKE